MGANRKGKWRNGRRARFRSVCPKGRGGSTPPLPTRKQPRVIGSRASFPRGFLFVPPRGATPWNSRADERPRVDASEASTSGLPSRPVRHGPSWRCRGGGPEHRGPSVAHCTFSGGRLSNHFPRACRGDLYLLSQFVSTGVSRWKIFGEAAGAGRAVTSQFGAPAHATGAPPRRQATSSSPTRVVRSITPTGVPPASVTSPSCARASCSRVTASEIVVSFAMRGTGVASSPALCPG